MVVAQTSAYRTSRPDTFSSAATPPVTSEKWCRDVKMITSINTVSLHHPRSARLSAGNTSRPGLGLTNCECEDRSHSTATAHRPRLYQLNSGWQAGNKDTRQAGARLLALQPSPPAKHSCSRRQSRAPPPVRGMEEGETRGALVAPRRLDDWWI